MIQVSIDEEQLKALYLQKVDEKLKELEQDVFFMNSKQLQAYVNMSWPSIEKHILYDERFGAIRLGNRWLFHKKTVDEYMSKFYEAVRDQGGDIQKYVRK